MVDRGRRGSWIWSGAAEDLEGPEPSLRDSEEDSLPVSLSPSPTFLESFPPNRASSSSLSFRFFSSSFSSFRRRSSASRRWYSSSCFLRSSPLLKYLLAAGPEDLSTLASSINFLFRSISAFKKSIATGLHTICTFSHRDFP